MEIELFLEFFLSLLLVATLVAIAVKHIQIPYTIVLVLIGLFITVLISTFGTPVLIGDIISRDLIFLIMLPPLLFEGALNMNLEHLKRNIKTLMTLAIPGVLVSTFLTGGIIYVLIGRMIGLDLMVCFLFGAMISPTDPVSVLAIFKTLGASRRLSVIVEGESLFNDGTGVVIFGIILTSIGSDALASNPGMMFGMGILNFCIVTTSGLSLGAALGYAAYKFLGRIDDHLIEVTITFILSFGTYLLAEIMNQVLHDYFHTPYEWVSGVLAVVAAGLIIGNYGTIFSMSASTRVSLNTFWDFMTFIVNSLLFLLIGISIELQELLEDGLLILVAIGVVVLTRALVVYSASMVLNRFKAKLRPRMQHVMFWGGLRGAIPIALILGVLATPGSHPWKETLSHLVFGVVLFSLVVQGLTMRPLLMRMGMISKKDKEREYETKIGQAIAAKAALNELEEMHRSHEVSEVVYRKLKKKYEKRAQDLSRAIVNFLESEEVIHDQQKHHATKRSLVAQKGAVLDASKRGVISADIAQEILTDLDLKLDELEKERG